MREIPNQPSLTPGHPLVMCSHEEVLIDDVVRLASLELLFVNGFGDVVGEWRSEFNTSPSASSTPRFSQLAQFIAGLIANRAFVGHHVEAPLRVLAREFELASTPQPQFEIIDTLDLARQLLPALTSYSLDALCNRLKIQAPTKVQALWQLLCHLQALDPQDLTPELQLVAAPTPTKSASATLASVSVCISGFLPHADEAHLQAVLVDHGATVTEAPTASTNVVVLGLGFNPALAAFALSLNTPLLGIEWFDLLCQSPEQALQHAKASIPSSMAVTEPSFHRDQERQES
jgi:hypothetical protein